MSRILVGLLLVLAVAGVAAFFLLSGGPSLDDDGLVRDNGAETESLEDLGAMAAESEGSGKRRGEGSHASLLGRAGIRIGVGSAIGRVLDFATKNPIEGVRVRLVGTGYGNETIEMEAKSGEDGRFHLEDVAAGDDLVLAVTRGDEVGRTVAGIRVAAGKIEDLGTLWFGDGGTLEGKVVDLEGKGLADAEVRVLQGDFSEAGMMRDFFGFLSSLDRDPVAVASGVSDAAGRFRIEGVPPGPITVVATRPGHHAALKNTAVTKEGAVGGSLVLRMGVAEPLTGRVVDTDGKGVASARVAFFDTRGSEEGFATRRFVETGEDGTFRIDAPPHAQKLVAIVTADGYPTSFSEVTEREDVELVLRGGAELQLTIRRDDSGAPMPDAQIVAMASPDGDFGDAGSFLTGVADAQGLVVLQALPGKVMMVMIQHPDCGMGMYSPQAQGFMGGGAMMVKGPESMLLEEGTNAFELRVPRGLVVLGTVKDVDGKPLAGARVSAPSGFFGGGGGSESLTDENGAYRITVTPMGMAGAMVVVKAAGYVQDPESVSAGAPGSKTELEHDVVMLRATRVEGRVVGKGGKPAAGVEVKLRPATEGRPGNVVSLEMGEEARDAFTDGQGRYVIEDVAPGRKAFVMARGDGFVPTRSEPFEIDEDGGEARAPRLELKTGARLEIRVLGPFGDPVKGAQVEVRIEPKDEVYWSSDDRWRPFATLIADARGRVEVRDVPAGALTATAKAEGVAPGQLMETIRSDARYDTPLEIRLRAAVTVRGRVQDQHGDPVDQVWITLHVEGVEGLGVRTDDRGEFEIEGVPQGATFRVTCWKDGYSGGAAQVEDPSQPVEIVMKKRDEAIQKKIDELQAQTMALYQKMSSTENEAERQALMEEAMALQQEMARLQSEHGGEAPARVAVPAADR